MPDPQPPRAGTPEDRSNYTESGNPMESAPKFEVEKQAWINLPKRGACEITIAAREKDTSGKYVYQVKDKNGVLHNKGKWVPQEKLSDMG